MNIFILFKISNLRRKIDTKSKRYIYEPKGIGYT